LAFRQADLNPEEFERLQGWRRRVMRYWIATMAAALAVWLAGSAFSIPDGLAAISASGLAVLALLAARATYRGACPRCAGRIRFEPRVELPRACPHCGVVFIQPSVTEPPRP